VTYLHFHWEHESYDPLSKHDGQRLFALHAWLRLVRYAGLLAVARALGYRVVWTVHEVVPQETRSRIRDIAAGRVLARASHALIAHDHQTVKRTSDLLRIPHHRVAMIPHGSFDGVYPPGRPRAAVREELRVDSEAFTFLAFGHVRRYKQLDLLLAAFARVRRHDVALVVAGDFTGRFRDSAWEQAMLDRLRDAARRDSRIRLRIGFVPDDGVSELYGACDAAVLARSDGWTSGSLILAMSQGLPVVAARRPAYAELLGEGAAGWLFAPGRPESLAAALELAASDPDAAAAKGRAARRGANELDWRETGARTLALLLSTLNGRSRSHDTLAGAELSSNGTRASGGRARQEPTTGSGRWAAHR
jgi:glycosyltransferase involved in cell wall biosynthesis